ncbi:MAG: 1-acyl-sn-glycerol-3-phosphate acyltransferase [Pseudomonadota bacterium]
MRSSLLTVSFFVFTFCWAALALIVSLVGGQRTVRWFLRVWGEASQWLTRKILNATIEVRGLERFGPGERPALIAAKHQSELDTFIFPAMHPDLSAIAMEELTNYPLLGPILRKLDYILVSVEGKRANQMIQVVSGSRRAHEQGRPILIFPEGELMRVGSRHRYKSGVFHIYQALNCPAHPVALSCGLVWPQRKWRKRPHQTCVLEFLEPIPPGLDQAAFMAELERRIEEGTMALIREHGDPETVAIAEERHRLGLTNEDHVTVADLTRRRGIDLDRHEPSTGDAEADRGAGGANKNDPGESAHV